MRQICPTCTSSRMRPVWGAGPFSETIKCYRIAYFRFLLLYYFHPTKTKMKQRESGKMWKQFSAPLTLIFFAETVKKGGVPKPQPSSNFRSTKGWSKRNSFAAALLHLPATTTLKIHDSTMGKRLEEREALLLSLDPLLPPHIPRRLEYSPTTLPFPCGWEQIEGGVASAAAAAPPHRRQWYEEEMSGYGRSG